MSLRASDAIVIELPRRLLAERLSRTAAVLAVLAAGWMSARHGGGALFTGMTVAAASVLAAIGRVQPPPGRWALVAARPVRCLGPTLVVHGVPVAGGPKRSYRLWLTPWDLPPDRLRQATLRLRAATGKDGS